MRRPLDSTGFRPPAEHPLGEERNSTVLVGLLATLALALSTLVAATVVTIGIARAGTGEAAIGHEGHLFGFALLLGATFIGIAGVAVLPSHKRR